MEVRHQSLTLVVLSMLVAGCPSNTDWSWSGLAESGDKASESGSTAPKPEAQAKPEPPKVEASATWTPRTPEQIRKEGNFLRESGSLYLAQHANNPMEWYPWDDTAFARAIAEDKPIFLSVGYASCHWCHVMEDEVFSDDEIAAYMNENYINIKVDREERPDVDAIYMDAVLKMRGSGGWPMSVVITPSLKPFFGGTYFPKAHFLGLMKRSNKRFQETRSEVEAQGEVVFEEISEVVEGYPEMGFDARILKSTVRRALEVLDPKWGGTATDQKFPTPVRWRYLVSAYRKWGDAEVKNALVLTLDNMASGGLYDHVGGGFHRYAVDKTWVVPHFEKMLYDNAQMASLFLEAGSGLSNPNYTAIGLDTLDFMLKELYDKEGGFYASYDAASAGKEGHFYVWKPAELASLAGKKDGEALAAMMGVTEEGNFEDNTSVVTRRRLPAKVALELDREVEELEGLFEKWRPTLYQVRAKRDWPRLDTKMVTGWNGLAISAMAEGYRLTGRKGYLDAAEKTAQRMWRTHRGAGDMLLRAKTDGEGDSKGILDDYAYLAVGLINLFEVTSDVTYLKQGIALVKTADERFGREEGGWYQTEVGDKSLLFRHFELYDSVRPSGNAMMLEAHLRLSALRGDEAHQLLINKTLGAYTLSLSQSGLGVAGWTRVALRAQGPFYEVVIAGEDRTELERVWREVNPTWALRVDLPRSGAPRALASVAPTLSSKPERVGRATAYVCQKGVCKAPTAEPAVFKRQLLEGWLR